MSNRWFDAALRTAWIAVGSLIVLGCSGDSSGPTEDGISRSYVVAPNTIYYHYLDTRTPDELELTWVRERPYSGFACLRFTPQDTLRDTVGVFTFIRQGLNAGAAERRIGTNVDTVQAYLFTGLEGTGGRYLISADQHVSLLWDNGTQARFFDSTATHVLSGDTLWSTADLSYYADSLRATWRVGWLRATCS